MFVRILLEYFTKFACLCYPNVRDFQKCPRLIGFSIIFLGIEELCIRNGFNQDACWAISELFAAFRLVVFLVF